MRLVKGFVSLLALLPPLHESVESVPPRSPKRFSALTIVLSTSCRISALTVGTVRSTPYILFERAKSKPPNIAPSLEAVVPLGSIVTPLGGNVKSASGVEVLVNVGKTMGWRGVGEDSKLPGLNPGAGRIDSCPVPVADELELVSADCPPGLALGDVPVSKPIWLKSPAIAPELSCVYDPSVLETARKPPELYWAPDPLSNDWETAEQGGNIVPRSLGFDWIILKYFFSICEQTEAIQNTHSDPPCHVYDHVKGVADEGRLPPLTTID